MNEVQLERVIGLLDRMTRLLAISITRGLPQGEAIELLDQAGLPKTDIAAALGTSPNAVSVTLYKKRRSGSVEGRGR